MREIKFRFFDKESKQLSRGYTLDELKQIFSGATRNTGVEAWFGFNWPTLIKSQFTGLKDKNGKEIFEGDILEKYPKVRGKVIFDEDVGCFKVIWEELSWDYVSGDKEVIGNIYENPELLEESK